jgi:DNA-binding MarR family transcriptional regulator
MNAPNPTGLPLGIVFYTITRKYVGCLSEKLKHLPIDKYFTVLLIIHRAGNSLSQQKIADQLKVDKASMVRILDYLINHELLEKNVNELNRREYLISLTNTAKKLIPEIEAAAAETNKLLFNGVNQSEKKVFLKVLDSIAAQIDDTHTVKKCMALKPSKKN